jgi:enoyl-CoA hydratase/carnithine racemase
LAQAPADPAARARGEALIADLTALGGAGLQVTELGDQTEPEPTGPGVIRLGVHRGAAAHAGEFAKFDILLSADPEAPRPWVGLPAHRLDGAIAAIAAQVSAQPAAAAAAAQVLRVSLKLSFAEALTAESLAYSMLLASDGFRSWRGAKPARHLPDDGAPRVLIEAHDERLDLRLNRPATRNAFDARMRDELVEALDFAGAHPDAPAVILSGAGPAFSAGGDMNEFGRADDVARAHLIRTLRAPVAMIHDLGERVTARLHGACIGAGIEVPAAAGRIVAQPGAFFRLPEVAMGLIPGAGGTASIPRRIGRRRATYMAISGAEIDLATALAWGLVDEVEA